MQEASWEGAGGTYPRVVTAKDKWQDLSIRVWRDTAPTSGPSRAQRGPQLTGDRWLLK